LHAVAGTAAATTTQAPPAVTRDYRYDPDNDHDSHDYMEVD
jgi:hypothetical protein